MSCHKLTGRQFKIQHVVLAVAKTRGPLPAIVSGIEHNQTLRRLTDEIKYKPAGNGNHDGQPQSEGPELQRQGNN